MSKHSNNKKQEENIGDMLKQDFNKYSTIVQKKSKEMFDNVKPKLQEIKEKAEPFVTNTVQKSKELFEEGKKQAKPFMKKTAKKSKEIFEKCKKEAVPLFKKLGVMISNLFDSLSDKIKTTHTSIKSNIKYNKESKSSKKKEAKIKVQKENIKEKKLFTPFRIAIVVLLLIILLVFSKPIFYNLFYDDGEVKLLSPPENKFKYPKATEIECPIGRDCSSGFSQKITVRGGCPISCNDDDPKTTDYCSETTNYLCVNE